MVVIAAQCSNRSRRLPSTLTWGQERNSLQDTERFSRRLQHIQPLVLERIGIQNTSRQEAVTTGRSEQPVG